MLVDQLAILAQSWPHKYGSRSYLTGGNPLAIPFNCNLLFREAFVPKQADLQIMQTAKVVQELCHSAN